jgi:flagellar biosynthetic protein FliR
LPPLPEGYSPAADAPVIRVEMTPILLSNAEIIRFFIVLMRVSGILVFAPFFSSQSFPVHVRIAFSLVAAYLLAPSLPLNKIPLELELSGITGLVLNEVLLGLILGFAAMCVFAGLQFAGQMISFQLGFSLIKMIDPQSNVEAPVFSLLENYIGLLFFLMINGHHWFLLAINESFTFLPVGGVHLGGPLVDHVVRLSAHVLVIGLRIAGPVIAVGIITDIIVGVVGRTAPQINILIVGMPLKVLIGFGCLSLSFYFLPRYLGDVYSALHKTLFSLMHAMV